MKNLLLLTLALFLTAQSTFAIGEASNYFNIYVPAGNENSGKDVYVVVTALYDNTTFNIADDGADGDTDDSKSGTLMQGQSYVLFLRDNGVNDDADHAGESNAKQDGDYLVITSSRPVTAVQGTLSAWQHDWATSLNKTAKGEQFVIYSNTTNGASVNDLNVFAYEDSTTVIVRKISTVALNKQGFTKVDMARGTVVLTKTICPGQDLIHYCSAGKDILQAGETYLVTANKAVTVQYGALAGDSRDAGGYVPASNGLSSGALFYFAVPYQSGGAQEIRISSWDDNNDIVLERYTAAGWVNVKTFRNVNAMKPVDWIGATYGKSYANEFRVSCTPGKRISVLEANFMETGTPGSADMATMVATDNGTAAGKNFLVYMAPPSRQNRMTNPFTGRKLTDQTHAYVYARTKCIVIVKDANTNGAVINKKYTIEAGNYADVSLDMYEWQAIFNGTGLATSGKDRPYLVLQSTGVVTVMGANTNDNWLMSMASLYTGMTQQNMKKSADEAKSGDTISINTAVTGNATINAPTVELAVSAGAKVIECVFVGNNGSRIDGQLQQTASGTRISIPGLQSLNAGTSYALETKIIMPEYTEATQMVTVNILAGGSVDGHLDYSSSAAVILNHKKETQHNIEHNGIQNAAQTATVTDTAVTNMQADSSLAAAAAAITGDNTDMPAATNGAPAQNLAAANLNSLPARLAVYPNPLTDGDMTISLSAGQSLKTISIASIDGRIVSQQNDINTQEFRIARSYFQQPGIYIILLNDYSNNQYSTRIEIR